MAKERLGFVPENHDKKVIIAGVEMFLFSVVGSIYPPAYIGSTVIFFEALRQIYLSTRDINNRLFGLQADIEGQLGQLQTEINQLKDDVGDIRGELALLKDELSSEPVPPDPATASQAEVEAYKEAVLRGASNNQVTD